MEQHHINYYQYNIILIINYIIALFTSPHYKIKSIHLLIQDLWNVYNRFDNILKK